ncbi:MAG: CPBP family intramembrane glutamic endopeptidase, partial [Candidatus Anstonellales archaeon]
GIHKVGLFFTDLLIMVVFMAIPLYYYLSEGRSIAESIALLGLELRVKWTGVILNGISGAIQMFIISFFISLLLSVIGINDQNKIQEKVSQFPVHIILAAIVLSPLSEEILFRGFLYRHFGLVVSSAVFSISHLIYGSAAELVVTFFLGAFLCRMVEKTNSLYPAVIAHGIFNLTAIIYIRVLAGGSL